MNETKKQHLADFLTTAAMASVYGERFLQLEDIEEDAELNAKWEYLNEQFYITIDKVF